MAYEIMLQSFFKYFLNGGLEISQEYLRLYLFFSLTKAANDDCLSFRNVQTFALTLRYAVLKQHF